MSLDACAEIVRKSDPDRFRAIMVLDVDARQKLFPLFAFNSEVARAPWVTQEPLIAQMRLQWWHDVLDEIASGKPVRKHEVATELAQILSPDLATELKSLVSARQWDIGTDGFVDLAMLYKHIDAVYGTLMSVALGVLGHDQKDARSAGFVQGSAAWLVSASALLAVGRQPLPGDTIHSISELAGEGRSKLRNLRSNKLPKAAKALMMDADHVLRVSLNDPNRVLAGSTRQSEFGTRFRLLRQSFMQG